MLLLRAVLYAVLGFGVFARANVEKVIFTAPARLPTTPELPPSLKLNILSRDQSTLRTHLSVAFPTSSAPAGLQSWYLLDSLVPDRRYEVRICWAATVCVMCFTQYLKSRYFSSSVSGFNSQDSPPN